jgi:PhnB protein
MESISMATKPKTPPDGYHTFTPYLIIKGAARAIEFYKQVFGATERCRLAMPDGKIGHAEIQIGDSVIMLADGCPEMGAKDPEAYGGSPVMLHLYLPDVDATFAKATAAGAKPLRPIQNQFYGDRSGMVTDPFGHVWNISTHIEDVSPEEINKRAAALFADKGGKPN